jgi:hypothetical protein
MSEAEPRGTRDERGFASRDEAALRAGGRGLGLWDKVPIFRNGLTG